MADFDPSSVLLSVALVDARALADRIATTWSAAAPDGLDEHGLEVLSRTLTTELPRVRSGQVPTLAAAVADTARALAAARWRERGRERPDSPPVDRSAVRGALLIHLHGLPDGPVSVALRRHHEEGLRLHAVRGTWRSPPPTREQLERYARALRAHEEEMSMQLAGLDGGRR